MKMLQTQREIQTSTYDLPKRKIRADLHYHGPIGFQPYWLKVQGYGRVNLLEEITDACLARDVDIVSITSEEKEIQRDSVHDRFGWLASLTGSLTEGYRAGLLGKNVLVVERAPRKLYLINSQTVMAKEDGKVIDHLVAGSNEVPNFRTIEDTLKYGNDRELIQIAEHPLCEAHQGMGAEKLKRYVKMYDAIEGHNSQLVFKGLAAKLPGFRNFRRDLNTQAQQFAAMNYKPWIAVSDGHRIEDAGVSYIEFDESLLRTESGDDFLASLKKIVSGNHFTSVCEYLKFKEWRDWVLKFRKGIKKHRDEF